MGKGSAEVYSGYLRTVDGILKIIEMILSLIVFILGCIIIDRYSWYFGESRSGWLIFCGIVAFIVVLIFFLLKLLGRMASLPGGVPWTLIEFILNLVFAIFFLICGIFGAIWFRHHDLWAAACIISFLDMLAFLINAYFLFRDWRAGGVTVVTKTTTVAA